VLREAVVLMAKGLPRRLAAEALGVDASTLERWTRRQEQGRRLVLRRGPGHPPLPGQVARAAKLVRDLKGLVGADAICHSVPGLSRRLAAAIKAETCTAMERERKQHLKRITITVAGVLRGFDAMELGGQHLFVAADGSVPYRTSWKLVPRYTGIMVAQFLGNDFSRHGAPLVLRMDRAKQHDTTLVKRVLARYQVMVLKGPAYRAAYYGQLERQNQEHRRWLARLDTGQAILPGTLRAMMSALNGRWRRRELGFKTAADVWKARPQNPLSRVAFRKEVERRTAMIRNRINLRGNPADFPRRLAIEQTLLHHGLMVRKPGGWC
jgi:hypothetical protein